MMVFYWTSPHSHEVTLKHKPLTAILNNFKAKNQLHLTQASPGTSVCRPLCLRKLQWTSATWHHLQPSVTPMIRNPHNLPTSECAGGGMPLLSNSDDIRSLQCACTGLDMVSLVGIYKHTNSGNTHLMPLLVYDWCSQSYVPSRSHTETEPPQYKPEAPSLSMQRQTVVFRFQRALKNQMYASLEKPH